MPFFPSPSLRLTPLGVSKSQGCTVEHGFYAYIHTDFCLHLPYTARLVFRSDPYSLALRPNPNTRNPPRLPSPFISSDWRHFNLVFFQSPAPRPPSSMNVCRRLETPCTTMIVIYLKPQWKRSQCISLRRCVYRSGCKYCVWESQTTRPGRLDSKASERDICDG